MKTKIFAVALLVSALCQNAYSQDAFTSETSAKHYLLTNVETYLGVDLSYSEEGAKVINVYPNSPAYHVLRTGDIINSIGGNVIKTEADYKNVLKIFKPGDDAKVNFTRRGKARYAKMTFDKINIFEDKK